MGHSPIASLRHHALTIKGDFQWTLQRVAVCVIRICARRPMQDVAINLQRKGDLDSTCEMARGPVGGYLYNPAFESVSVRQPHSHGAAVTRVDIACIGLR